MINRSMGDKNARCSRISITMYKNFVEKAEAKIWSVREVQVKTFVKLYLSYIFLLRPVRKNDYPWNRIYTSGWNNIMRILFDHDV